MDTERQPSHPSEQKAAKPPTSPAPSPPLGEAFGSNTTVQAWMEFLGQVQKLQKDPDTAVSICPKVLMYKDKDTKSSRVRAAKRDGANTLDVNGEGITIVSTVRELKSTGTIVVLINSLANAVDQKRIDSKGGPNTWHTYAIYYGDGILAIYDPSFEQGPSAVQNCKGIPLARYLVTRMRMKTPGFGKRLNSIWIGGGGGDSAQSPEMTRAWIYEEVCVKKGRDLRNWQERDGWVQLRY